MQVVDAGGTVAIHLRHNRQTSGDRWRSPRCHAGARTPPRWRTRERSDDSETAHAHRHVTNIASMLLLAKDIRGLLSHCVYNITQQMVEIPKQQALPRCRTCRARFALGCALRRWQRRRCRGRPSVAASPVPRSWTPRRDRPWWRSETQGWTHSAQVLWTCL